MFPPRRIVLGLVALLIFPWTLQGEAGVRDWPQFGGPNRDNRSTETGLLLDWPKDGPREVWRQSIGEGFSGIAISGGRLFTMASDSENEYAMALDPNSGKELWRTAIGPLFSNEFGNGPRATPTVDGEVVFVFTSQGRLAALDAKDGHQLWLVDLPETYGSEVPRFGYSTSGLVVDDLLLMETGGVDGHALIAFDKATGKKRWAALDGAAAYSSPVVANFDGVRQILFFRRTEPRIVSLLPDGEIYWTHEGLSAVLHMPLVVPPDGVFISSTHDATGFMLRVREENGKPVAEEAWRTTRMKNHFNTSVVVDSHMYGFDNAIFKSLDASTGEQNWARRGLGKGSLIEVEGHLLVLSDSGEIAVVEANPEKYIERGRFQAMTGRAWTPPTLADGRLYLRDQDEILSLDLKTAPASFASASGVRPRAASTEAAPMTAAPRDPSGDLNIETVLKRYAEARGGAERWRQTEGLEIHGAYTSYSIEERFSLLKQRDGRYLFDTVMNGRPTVHGIDAHGPWWIDRMTGTGWAQRPAGLMTRQIQRAAELESPLLRAEEKGHQVELAGTDEINGQETLKLGVTLASGAVETWYLDPTTYLEVAVDSMVLDRTQGGEPLAERAYFADFRDVDGLRIAHRVERECVSRHTVLEIEDIQINPPNVGEDRFALRVDEEMAVLRPLVGEWRLEIESRFSEEAPWQSTSTSSTITPLLDGTLLEERFSYVGPEGPVSVVRHRSWDRFRQTYRLTQIDNRASSLLVFVGGFENGRLMATNESTETAPIFRGTEILERQTTSNIGADGFLVEWEQSTDGGETWLMNTKYTYRRAP